MPVTLVYGINTPDFVFDPQTDEGFLMPARYWGRKNADMSEESRTMVARTTYVGAVLAKQEENWYSDSDFYAIVWNSEENKVTRVEYGSTRHAGIGNAEIDATEDTINAATKWLEEWYYNHLKDQFLIGANDPTKGKIVKSIIETGPKAGIVGEIKWRGPNKFRRYYANGYNKSDDPKNHVVGIKVEGQESLVFIPVPQVKVIGGRDLLSEEDLWKCARTNAQQRLWTQPFTRRR